MLGIVTRNRHRNRGRPAEKSAEGFKQWLRGRPCFLERTGNCMGKIEAAHVDHAGGKGIGTKVADRHCLPFCSYHHASQHRDGWRTTEAEYQFDAVKTAERYWQAWPGRRAWEAKQDGN